MKYIPYLYVIGWTCHDVWYVGIQYGQKSNPDNLWTTYFTSSNYVKQFVQENGDPDQFQIIKYETAEQVIEAEIDFIKANNVLADPRWLNKNGAGAIFMDSDVRDKISKSLTGKPRSETTKEKLRNVNLGKQLSNQTKEKLSKAHKNRIRSDEHQKKLNDSNRKKALDVEFRKKLSASNYKRWSDPEYKEKMITNKRAKSKQYFFDGKFRSVAEISELTGIKYNTLRKRLLKNQSLF